MRPFFPYYGSKWNAARHYGKPAHDTVVEPFAGSAGYATFYDVPNAILIDKDPIIVGVWDFLICASRQDVMTLPNLLNEGDCVEDYVLPPEAKWLIGFWLNRGSAIPKLTRTAYSARQDRAQLTWGEKAKQRIVTQQPNIIGWVIREGDYYEAPDIEATWFIDPPYQDKGRYYRKPFDNFEELASWCTTRKGAGFVCEGLGATWLPFMELGTFKTTKGSSKEFVFAFP